MKVKRTARFMKKPNTLFFKLHRGVSLIKKITENHKYKFELPLIINIKEFMDWIDRPEYEEDLVYNFSAEKLDEPVQELESGNQTNYILFWSINYILRELL